MDAPREKAVALLYDQSKSAAPKVVASGSGKVAEKIIAAAREAGVHIQKDANLIELLAKVPVGEEIPMALYATVAEVLAFVYRVNDKYKAKLEQQGKTAASPEKNRSIGRHP